MAETNNILEVKNLSIQFGGLRAVDGLNMTIRRGQLYGLIGPNGAGKTTVFNMLTGVYKPTAGTILLDGENITGNHGGAGATCCGASIQCVADGMPASYELRNKTHDHGDHQADGGQNAAQCAHYLVRTQNGIGVGEPLHHAQEQ